MTATDLSYDIVVVGGGLSGFAAAIFAARAGFTVLHLAPEAPPDLRTSALMAPSVAALIAADLIDDPAAIGTPLRNIRIVDCTGRLLRAPETLFESQEAGLDAFGWNFANAKLLAAFMGVAAKLDNYASRSSWLDGFVENDEGVLVDCADGTRIRCALLVGADGKKSMVRAKAGIGVRERTLEQSALVCDVELTRGLEATSVELHYPNGPFTLVPAGGNTANLVWIDRTEALQSLRAASPEVLAAQLEEKSAHLFGTIKPITSAHLFSLSQFSADHTGKGRVVLVGEAAHAFPPIGAQGLNLSLRDVAALGAVLDDCRSDDAGWAVRVTEAYAQARAADLQRTSGFVNALFSSLVADMLPAQMLRAGGLWALKLIPALRKRAFSVGMGGTKA